VVPERWHPGVAAGCCVTLRQWVCWDGIWAERGLALASEPVPEKEPGRGGGFGSSDGAGLACGAGSGASNGGGLVQPYPYPVSLARLNSYGLRRTNVRYLCLPANSGFESSEVLREPSLPPPSSTTRRVANHRRYCRAGFPMEWGSRRDSAGNLCADGRALSLLVTIPEGCGSNR